MTKPPTSRTVGWEPGCGCQGYIDDAVDPQSAMAEVLGAFLFRDPVPCVVLDPFIGSGTTLAVATQLGPHGIAVNAVCPGWVRTDASMRSLAEIARREGRDEQVCLDEIMATQAFEGLMEPDDVASTFLFLASDQAANITGQTLNVDRGELMA